MSVKPGSHHPISERDWPLPIEHEKKPEMDVPGSFFRNRTLIRVSLYAAIMAAYATLPTWIETRTGHENRLDMPADVHVGLTLVLGWLLVFRTNTSYNRWWEARTLWGRLINTSRNMAIKVADLVQSDRSELEEFQREIIAFSYALRDHLREDCQLQNLPGFEDCPDTPEHVPSYLVGRMYERLGEWKANKTIAGIELRVLDAEARQFLDLCGGCERIKNTRTARSYRAFARQCVGLYLATLPWGIVDSFHWWTVPLTAIISYFMLGLETVAEDVEEPFGHDIDDLDLDKLCLAIESSVTEVFQRRFHLNAQKANAELTN